MRKKYPYSKIKERIEKNGLILLSEEYTGSNENLKILCSKGHEFYRTLGNLKRNYGCPICKKKTLTYNKLTYEYVKSYIESFGYTLLSKEYKRSDIPINVRCSKGHEYKTTFTSFKQCKCPFCTGTGKRSISYIRNEIEKTGHQLLSKIYKDSYTKMKFKCPIGHEYETDYRNFIRRKEKCNVCGNKVNGKFTYEYVKSYIESFGYTLLSKEYKRSDIPINVRCSNGHEYNVTFSLFNQGHRCFKCDSISQRTPFNEVKSYIESFGYTLLSKEYKRSGDRLKFMCNNGHIYYTSFGNFKSGYMCHKCWKSCGISKAEIEVQSYCKELRSDIICNDRNELKNPFTNRYLELDIWIPIINKAIEYNGDYWHSREDRKNNDKIKKELCCERGIDLMVIKECDWVGGRENIKNKIQEFILT